MTQQPADRSGEVLDGRYSLEALVGRGGMAEVYRATDQVLGRTVAVKILHPGTVSEDAMRRHEVEARIGAGVSHPGLVTVFDVHAQGSAPYLVMEYVDGQTLADVLERGTLAPEVVAEVGAQLASALAVVHDSAVVHRDIKPSNVMIVVGPDRTVSVKLTDFGVSRFVEETRLTSPELLVGTARYLAPEQAAGETVHAPADIYALGLVLLECLTGQDAFPGTRVESLSARLHRPPAVPERLGQDWGRVLGAMTARDPAVRPGARAVASAMRALAAGGDVAAALGPLAVPVSDATSVLGVPRPAAADDRTVATDMPLTDPTASEPAPASLPPSDVPAYRKPSPSRTPWVVAAVVLAVLLVVGGVAFALNSAGNSGDTPSDGTTPSQSASPSGRPTTESTTEPTDRPTTEPSTEPTTAPTTKPTTAPTTEPTTEATTAPTTKPTTAPTTEPAPSDSSS